ncbi:MAG: hypothetical protein E6760_09850, partial [Eggerthella sp.]|nr:hypothetical protein [Eggerthella sp.]
MALVQRIEAEMAKKHRIRNASQALSKRRARHQKKCSSQSGIMRGGYPEHGRLAVDPRRQLPNSMLFCH